MFGRKKRCIEAFALQGNRNCIRSEEEMQTVDKAVADAAFLKYSKKILGEFLKRQGFLKWKTNAFVRMNATGVLEYIDLQKERYGSKTFTVNYAMMPLYVPNESMIIGFGDRLGTPAAGRDVWWDYATEEAAAISFRNVTDAIEQFILPWFQSYDNKETLKKKLRKDSKTLKAQSYKNREWLEAIDNCESREEVIWENIERLKLPKKLHRKDK